MQHTFKAQKPCRLSIFLRQAGVSRSLMCYLKQYEGAITVNGENVHTDYMLSAGDIAGICEPEEKDGSIIKTPEPAVLKLYEDGEAVVFDKPPMMPCHPSAKHVNDTLANYYAFLTGGRVFRCINRLDRDTSGCCLVAKSRYSAANIGQSVKKTYYAICQGTPPAEGVIEIPIRRTSDSIIKRECASDGQYAKTAYRVLDSFGGYSLCEVTLGTGRTHQIRVHFSHIGYPLAGDDMYGGSLADIGRQALHCGKISFISPDGEKAVTVTSDLPEDMKRLITPRP